MNFEATLFTGRKVVVRELTTQDEDLALKALGSQGDIKSMATQKEFINEMVKMMLVAVDGKPVTYQTMTSLSDLFRTKEIRQLEHLYTELHVPSEDEDNNFLTSIKPHSTEKSDS